MTETIITWQPVLTDHQAFTFSALAEISGSKIDANVLYNNHPDRAQQGWTSTSFEDVGISVHAGPLRIIQLIKRMIRHRGDVHIFCSPWEKPSLMLCLFVCAALKCRYYLITEPYSPSDTPYFGTRTTFLSGLKRKIRPLLYRGYGLAIRSSVSSIFAISDLAYAQYVEIGIDPGRIIPFGYYIPSKQELVMPRSRDVAVPLRVVFIGSISFRKGIDTLIRTFRFLHERGIRASLDVYGPGELRHLEPVPPNVEFRGRIPFGQSQNVLRNYDVLVLLSRHDGWAVVVNEAILVGLPVICTETVGAARLVRDYEAGIVVPAEDAEASALAITKLASDLKELQRLHVGAFKAAKAIQPEQAAETLWRAIKTPGCQKSEAKTCR